MSEIEVSIPGYKILRRLGTGGMATVYLGVQDSLDRKVAIKVMHRAVHEDPSDEKRFLMEGRTLARLPHPNIVGVYDIFHREDLCYIAMEYLDGLVLSDQMRAGITLSEAIGVIVQIADALQFAHDNGVIHRDLKPGNILFRGKRTPVLTDFGIARVHGGDVTRLTRTGMMVGTPAYMSPEQAMGKEVDGRSDQYSLGVLLYELLTQKVPFERDTPMQVAYAHVYDQPRELPLKFSFAQPLIDRMMAKDPAFRFPDLKAFVRELRDIVTNNPALQQRLNVNASQDVSERLRALGFSDNQIHSGSSPRGPLLVAPVPKDGLQPGELVQQLIEHSDTKLELAPIKEDLSSRRAVEIERQRSRSAEPMTLPIANIITLIVVAVAALLAAKYLFG